MKRNYLTNTAFYLSLFLLSSSLAFGQTVPFPEGYVVDKISPWGYEQVGTNWDTSPYLPFIYNGQQFRLMPPNGVAWQEETDTWANPSEEKYPIILFFNGVGENGSDNNKQLLHGGRVHRDAVLSDEFPGFLLYPQGVSIQGMKVLLDVMIAEGIPIDPTRVYVHGLSRGAVWTWEFAKLYPETVAAIFPMSGVIDGTDAEYGNMIYSPVRLAQGGQDGNPNPDFAGQEVAQFQGLGGYLEYFLLPDKGHGTWNTMYNRDDFFSWFLEQKINKIYAKADYFEVCPSDPIDVTLGVNPGLDAYVWYLDGELLEGKNTHEISVDAFGDYTVQVTIGGQLMPMSDPLTVGLRDATDTPPIEVAGSNSYVLPDPNGLTSVILTLPAGYESYEWFKDGELVGSSRTYDAEPGEYTALVQELYTCSSNLSDPFTVLENTGVGVPNTPNTIFANPTSKTSVNITWIDNSINETSFELYRRKNEDEVYSLIALLPEGTESYEDDGLLAGMKYLYSLRAINGNGSSAISSEVEVTTESDIICPTTPLNLERVSATADRISLGWLASTDDVEVKGYFIYQDGVKVLFTKELNATIYNLTQGKVYRFQVSAVDPTGNESALSNRVVAAAVSSGLNFEYYEGNWSALPDFEALGAPLLEGISTNTDISLRLSDNYFGFIWRGYIKIPVAGSYTFETQSDDGSKLYLGGYDESDLVVDNDGLHGSRYRDGTVSFESPGTYPIVMTFFERTGGQLMNIYWKNTAHGVGSSRELIPDEMFSDNFVFPDEEVNEPGDLAAEASSYDQVDLSWTDNSLNETSFQIYRSEEEEGLYAPIAMLGADVTSYSDTSLVESSQYFYKIIALGEYVQSVVVGPIGATTPPLPDAPEAPLNFAVASTTINSIELAWDMQVVDAYVIKRSISENGTYSVIANLDGTESSYVDEDLSAHTDYYYTISSSNIGGTSPDSERILGTTLNTPPTISTFINDITLAYDSNTSIIIEAQDLDGDELVFSPVDFPDFISLTSESTTSSRIDIIPGSVDEGEYSIGVMVSDDFGGNDLVNFNVTVLYDAPPVILELQSHLYSEVDGELQVEVFADRTTILSFDISDEDSEVVMPFVEDIPAFGSFETISSSAVNIVLQPSESDLGFYNVYLKATDTNDTSTFEFQVSVLIDPDDTNPVSNYESVFVNFALDDALSVGAPWNDFLGTPLEGVLLENLLNEESAYTSIDVSLENEWSAAGNDGATTGDDSGIYPDNVMATGFADGSVENRVLKLSDLDQTKVYDLIFFSSFGVRGAIEPTEVTFNTGESTVSLVADNNTSNAVVINALTPIDGEILVGINHTSGSMHYLNAMEIRYYDEPDIPVKATNLLASTISESAIELVWDDNSSNEDGFEIDRAMNPVGPWTNVATTSSNAESFIDTGLDNNTAYNYRVRSYNSNGYAQYSEVAQATTFDVVSVQSVNINFSTATWAQASAPWNNMLGQPIAGMSLQNLTNNYGVTTSFDITLNEAWGGGNTNGVSSGNNSGIYPDVVTSTYLENSSGLVNQLVLSDLDPTKLYDVSFFASRAWVSGYNTTMTINGSSVNLIVSDNVDNLGVIEAIPPDSNGEILITFTSNGASPIFLGALILEYYEEPLIPFIPTNLEASGVTHNEIALEWSDNSSNETGFEIYRTDNPSAGWSLIATTEPGVEYYSDIVDLSASTKYYYKLLAFNEEGSSDFGNVSSASTYEYFPYQTALLNFSSGSSAPSPWNNIIGPPDAGLTRNNLLNNFGGPTTMTLELLDSWLGSNGYGATTGDDTGAYPDVVMQTFFNDASGEDKVILLSGLDASKLYDFTLFSSRAWLHDNRSIQMSIGGNSVTLVGDDNTSETASIKAIYPSESGEIELVFKNPSGSPSMYLNAIEIRYYDEPTTPFKPTGLLAQAESYESVSLEWKDESFNEDGFRIFKSNSANGPWDVVEDVLSDVVSYTVSGLTSGQSYYFKVQSFKGENYSDDSNIASSTTFEYVPYQTVLVSFAGNTWTPIPNYWNYFSGTPDAGLSFGSLINNYEQATSMNIELMDSWGGFGDNGATTGDDSGVFPDNVMRTYYSDDSGEQKEIKFSGLDVSKNYDFIFFSSRAWLSDNKVTEFSINGNSATVKADDNTSNTAILRSNIPDSNGEIIVSCNMPVNSTGMFLNAVEIRYYDEPVIPFAPSGVVAQSESHEDIILEWVDNSSNEDGFNIYRSMSESGPWGTAIGSVGANETTYTDGEGLEHSTEYFYYVEAFNDNGVSGESGVANATTFPYAEVQSVHVNFSANTWAPIPEPWNYFSGAPNEGVTHDALKNNFNQSTNMAITLLDAWTGSGENGTTTGDDSGVYPDNIMSSYYADNSGESRSIMIHGLDVGKYYDLTFFSSRAWTTTEFLAFSVNGVSVQLNAASNTSEVATVVGVRPNSNGEIVFDVSRVGTAGSIFLNALIIEYYDNLDVEKLTPDNPSNMSATALSDTYVTLDWNDNSDNETGFEVYRSEDSGLNWILLTTVGVNTQQYIDDTILEGEADNYIYRVRAVGAAPEVFSEFTNSAGTLQLLFSIFLNFNVTDPENSPWNNINQAPYPGLVVNDMNTSTGQETGIKMKIVEDNPNYVSYGFAGDNPFGMITGDDSGIVPDNVMRSTYWMDPLQVAELEFSGLNLSYNYTFEFFASRDGGGDRTTDYSIGNKQVSLNASYNTSDIVSINNVSPDQFSKVLVKVATGQFASFGYIGGMKIHAFGSVDQAARYLQLVEDGQDSDELLDSHHQNLVYPNPIVEGINVEPSSVDDLEKIILFDSSGREIIVLDHVDFEGMPKIFIEANDLINGVYFLRFVNFDKSSSIIRLIK